MTSTRSGGQGGDAAGPRAVPTVVNRSLTRFPRERMIVRSTHGTTARRIDHENPQHDHRGGCVRRPHDGELCRRFEHSHVPVGGLGGIVVSSGVPPGERLLLVFGGSQAVRRLNAAVAGALPRLVERVTVLHVTGDAGYAEALANREALAPSLRPRYRPHPFLRDEMLAALAAADLVVGRAGSSTLAEVAALGLPMIVVPYPHAAGHQRANARVLVEAGAAQLIEDADFDAGALIDAAGLLDDPAAHARMSAASRSLGRPGAAQAVAELVLAAAHRQPLPDPGAIERRSRGVASAGTAGGDSVYRSPAQDA